MFEKKNLKELEEAHINGKIIQIKINCLNMFSEYEKWIDLINTDGIFDGTSELCDEEFRIKPEEE